MSNLAGLLLRESVDANYQTKGETLTYAELDANLQLLADVIRENIVAANPGGIESYDPSEEYSLDRYVTYAGNLWRYINATPATGNTPSEGAYWTLQSAGVLAHAQNTDTYTSSNTFGIGDGTAGIKQLYARMGGSIATSPRLRYNNATSKWQYTNDGTTFNDFVADAFVMQEYDFSANAGAYPTGKKILYICLDESVLPFGTWFFVKPSVAGVPSTINDFFTK